MIDMSILLNQMIMLFIIICIGYVSFKLHFFDNNTNKKLNKLVVNITLPMMIVSSVLTMTERPSGQTVLLVFIISLFIYALLPLLSMIIVKLFRMPKSQQGLYAFMLIFSNVAFMGFPVLQAAFGDAGSTAVFYAAILNIIFNFCAFTYGIIIIGYGTAMETAISLKSLLTPGILCSALSIVIYIFNIHFPTPVESAIITVGNLTSPLAMMLIGATLASMPAREIFKGWRIYLFTVIKLIILPLMCYPLLKLFIPDQFIFEVMFIELLMPVANTSLIFATEYNLDTNLSSKTIFITTAFSLITIPIMLNIFVK